MHATSKPRFRAWLGVVHETERFCAIVWPTKPPNSISANSAVLDAWQAWQQKLDKLNLTTEQKEQATAVLIKLMKARETRRFDAR